MTFMPRMSAEQRSVWQDERDRLQQELHHAAAEARRAPSRENDIKQMDAQNAWLALWRLPFEAGRAA